MNWDKSEKGFCQVWRSPDGETWEKVVDRGFRDFDTTEQTNNRYAWSMVVYNDELYIGTYNHPAFFGHQGGQLWKTNDGVNWVKVSLPNGDGFGEARNHGVRTLDILNEKLYVGVASMGFNALEIWMYDGDTWTPIIGDEVPGVRFKPWHKLNDGFGDRKNDYPYSMIVTSDDNLWVGTVNSGRGCEIHRYDGDTWEELVGNDDQSEAPNGFGASENVGVRSLMEFPPGSGTIFAVTATSFANPTSCQVWVRTETKI
jgi:hypothetical protein